jgi:hypothetical protein
MYMCFWVFRQILIKFGSTAYVKLFHFLNYTEPARISYTPLTNSVRRIIIVFNHDKRPERECEWSSPPSADVSAQAYTSSPLYSGTWPWCLMKHMDNFNFIS